MPVHQEAPCDRPPWACRMETDQCAHRADEEIQRLQSEEETEQEQEQLIKIKMVGAGPQSRKF